MITKEIMLEIKPVQMPNSYSKGKAKVCGEEGMALVWSPALWSHTQCLGVHPSH